MKIKSLGHVVLRVTDRERAERFYGGVLGLPLCARLDESGLKKVEAIINSMTPLERRRPDVLNGGRKKRIAMGSGTSVAEINRLLKQYRTMQKMMKGVQGKWLKRAMGMGGGARA